MTINDIEQCMLEFMREYIQLTESDRAFIRGLVAACTNKEFVKQYYALQCCGSTVPAREDVERLLDEWKSANGKSHAQSG